MGNKRSDITNFQRMHENPTLTTNQTIQSLIVMNWTESIKKLLCTIYNQFNFLILMVIGQKLTLYHFQTFHFKHVNSKSYQFFS